MDRQGFQSWLDAWVEAWKTYDPQKIGDLYSEDAIYRHSPADDGTRGRDAIVKSWLDNKDEPNTYDAKYEPLAIDGQTHVANGWTRYLDAESKPRDEYYNVYVCKFNDAGECTEFTETWMQKSEYRKAARDELVRRAKAGEA